MAKFDFNKQKEEFERMKRELMDINRHFEALKKSAGVTDEDLKNPMDDMPKEVLEAMQERMANARKMGKAAANAMMSRMRSDDAPTGVFSARARRGVISA